MKIKIEVQSNLVPFSLNLSFCYKIILRIKISQQKLLLDVFLETLSSDIFSNDDVRNQECDANHVSQHGLVNQRKNCA